MPRYRDLTRKNYKGVTLTDENPSIIRTLAQWSNAKNVVSISGGGEMPILSFLPGGAHVDAVDISYMSVGATIAKALLLERYGPDELKQLLSHREGYFFNVLQNEIYPSLPQPLKTKLGEDLKQAINSGNHWQYKNFIGIWQGTPNDVLDAARNNLQGLDVIHANMSKFGRKNKYDLVYVSNAIGWLPSSPLKPDDIKKMAKPGGRVISSKLFEYDSFQLLESVDLPKQLYTYYLFEVQEPRKKSFDFHWIFPW